MILLQIVQADGLNMREIGWQLPFGITSVWLEPLIGITAGVFLRMADRAALSPLAGLIQRLVGRYRLAPSIESTTAVGGRVAWLIAGTVFAGVVEESLYRGYAITRLRQRMGIGWAVVVSSVFFGPLHWGEGFGAVITTMVSGALLAGLFLWRQTLVTPAVAHAMTNLMVLLWR
ncbi:MAG TPA: CPBP family intramembrane glutamic endopeptidase [Candidatus Tectomicrobia bacterium]|nr:CPBP family intramembrane glutamic endopeptidase [Candidatus Tectomicrobia bacterium]